MAIKNNLLGGVDYSTPSARIKPTDLIDTDTSIIKQNIQNSELAVRLLQSNNVFTNGPNIVVDEMTDSTGTKNTINTGSSTAVFSTDKYIIDNTGEGLANSSYDSVTLDPSSNVTGLRCMYFKSDGTSLYIYGDFSSSGITICQYDLTTAWDLSTASFASESSALPILTNIVSLFVHPDGTSIFILRATSGGQTRINRYLIGTAWDISTLNVSGYSSEILVNSQDSAPAGLFLNSDGTKLFYVGTNTNTIYQYSMTTAWDLSTASYDSVSLVISGQTMSSTNIYFNESGGVMYICDASKVYQYNLTTAWDLSTASYSSLNYTLNTANNSDIYFNGLGKIYSCDYIIGYVYQYTVSDSLNSSLICDSNTTTLDGNELGFAISLPDSDIPIDTSIGVVISDGTNSLSEVFIDDVSKGVIVGNQGILESGTLNINFTLYTLNADVTPNILDYGVTILR